jgi:ACS family D-galactonate transporter-like MFS transporter
VTRPWIALVIICIAVFSAAISVFAIPPIIGALVRDFHIPYSKAALFMTVYTMVPAFGGLLIGWFKDRAGFRIALLAGLSLVASGGIGCSLSQDFTQMLLCRILLGIGATTVFTPSLATTLYLLAAKHVNFATGAFFGALNLGLSLALLVTPILASAWSWRRPLEIFAALPVLLIILVAFAIRSEFFDAAHHTGVQGLEQQLHHHSRSSVPLILVSAGNFFLFFQSFAIITWLPNYLKGSRGFTATQEGLVGMLLGLVVIPGSILAGWLADVIGGWLVAVTGASLCGLCPAIIVGLPNASFLTMAVTVSLLALGTSLLTIPLTSVLSQLVSHEHAGKAAGLIATTGYAGAIVSTYGGGYLLTRTGTYTWTFLSCTTTMVLTVVLLIFLQGAYERLSQQKKITAGAAG